MTFFDTSSFDSSSVHRASWADYHENGQMAANGQYVDGKQHGSWRFWDSDGNEEQPAEYRNGEEIA